MALFSLFYLAIPILIFFLVFFVESRDNARVSRPKAARQKEYIEYETPLHHFGPDDNHICTTCGLGDVGCISLIMKGWTCYWCAELMRLKLHRARQCVDHKKYILRSR